MFKHKDIDPKITILYAIEQAGSQAKLARLLSISRSYVNELLKAGSEYLPPLHAYRFERLMKKTNDSNPDAGKASALISIHLHLCRSSDRSF